MDETEETPAETPAETRIDEAENTAEIALDIADEQSALIATLQADIVALNERLSAIESELSNVRTNAGSRDISTADNRTETEGPPTEEPPIIKPRREHPYYRKLW